MATGRWKMRASKYIACLFIPLIAASGTVPDHLLPINRSNYPVYRMLLKAKLERTPFDCGRVVFRPPAGNEESVSVYHSTNRGVMEYFVTSLSAHDSIWEASEGGEVVGRANQIAVSRSDQTIPADLAQTVRTAFTVMIHQTRPIGSNEMVNKAILEGPIIEFSVALENHLIEGGEISYLPTDGPNLKALERLGRSLLAYSKASPSEHHQLRHAIDKDARLIISGISRRE